MPRTPIKKGATTTKNGNGGTTKSTSQISLEEEAKEFRQKKKPESIPLTSREYLAGAFGAAILINTRGQAPWAEIKRSAYELADYMLEDDQLL